MAYPDHLITDLVDSLGIGEGALVLDPFCGTGTTIVECKKLGISSVGIDANPAAVLATAAKVDWSLDWEVLRTLSDEATAAVQSLSDSLLLGGLPLFAGEARDLEDLRRALLDRSPEGRYLVESGMLERHWMDEVPFLIALALLERIKALDAEARYVRLLKLALASCLVEAVANLRFGPELYVVKDSGHADVLAAFRAKMADILADLTEVQEMGPSAPALVLQGDARECASLLRAAYVPQVDFVITSPPYPTEKDYTRNTRLELVFLGFVTDPKSLREIKTSMVRSHSKGIYKSDTDGQLVAEMPEIRAIADELRQKVRTKTYGFAKLYPRIIEEYFGGMYRHLRSVAEVMRPGGCAAYVVGEQRTYLQTYTPTGTILGTLAERPEVGFRVRDVLVWRVRQGTTGSGQELKEEIVILEKA